MSKSQDQQIDLSGRTLDVELLKRQGIAWDHFFDPKILEIMYGGGKGGGKSVWLCIILYVLSLAVIAQHKLKVSKNPPHFAWMGRKIGSDFVTTTLETWKAEIPEDCYKICSSSDQHPRHILILDRVAIDFGGLDSQKTINKFNSAEYGVIAVDQAEETTKDDVAVLMASRRLTFKKGKQKRPWLRYTKQVCDIVGISYDKDLDGTAYEYKGIWTTNPAQCWLKEDFIDKPQENYVFVPALPRDNKHLPKNYESVTLVKAFGHRPQLLRAYRDGDWSGMSGIEQIIQPQWITESKTRTLHAQEHKHHVSVDTALFGDDEFVIYGWDHTLLIGQDICGKCDEYRGAERVIAMCREIGAQHCTIETTGSDVGHSIITIVRNLAPDITVKEWFPQGAATDYRVDVGTDGKEKIVPVYYNLRAETWNYCAKQFKLGNIPIPETVYDYNQGGRVAFDEQLESQLCWPTYKFRGGKTLAEPKEDIKARKARSPDRGDCFVIGIWGEQFVETPIQVANRDSEIKDLERRMVMKWS